MRLFEDSFKLQPGRLGVLRRILGPRREVLLVCKLRLQPTHLGLKVGDRSGQRRVVGRPRVERRTQLVDRGLRLPPHFLSRRLPLAADLFARRLHLLRRLGGQALDERRHLGLVLRTGLAGQRSVQRARHHVECLAECLQVARDLLGCDGNEAADRIGGFAGGVILEVHGDTAPAQLNRSSNCRTSPSNRPGNGYALMCRDLGANRAKRLSDRAGPHPTDLQAR